jgi:hypothetical protein
VRFVVWQWRGSLMWGRVIVELMLTMIAVNNWPLIDIYATMAELCAR